MNKEENKDNIKEYSDIIIPCDCGCSIVTIGRDEDFAYIQFYVNSFYAKQDGYWKTFKRRLKMIWYIIRGKDYLFEDVSISIDKFKKLSKDIDKLTKWSI